MANFMFYNQTTNGISVSAYPIYLENQSVPEENHFLWAYHIRIENQSNKTIQLKSRHWKITDALGRVQEFFGDGVVGEQPIIKPGEVFEYTSGTPLATPSGIMIGSYQVQYETGEFFDVAVPAFSLDSPYQNIIIN